MFIDRLIDGITAMNNPSVIGLDPKLEYVPEFLTSNAIEQYGSGTRAAAGAILSFNQKIIDAVYDIVPAVKLQMAYYEMYGSHGIEAFEQTVKYAHSKGLLVIADAKRNDIGSTAEAYSSAFLGKVNLRDDHSTDIFGTDALTVNPYLGFDGIKPFVEDCKKYGKGIFILVKTSNKSSGQLQDLLTQEGKTLYEIVAEYVTKWGKELKGSHGYSSVGAVVGATYPNQAKLIRNILKDAYILVPAYGAQGGTARDAANCFRRDGMGAIISASRSIMCAYQSEMWKSTYSPERFAEASRAEAIRMRDDINKALAER